uniref:Uncharacterized protein n=1 Tax=Romanomermis culicivorax TaxID=13658 RepID=A0A915IDT8_ROMCU
MIKANSQKAADRDGDRATNAGVAKTSATRKNLVSLNAKFCFVAAVDGRGESHGAAKGAYATQTAKATTEDQNDGYGDQNGAEEYITGAHTYTGIATMSAKKTFIQHSEFRIFYGRSDHTCDGTGVPQEFPRRLS